MRQGVFLLSRFKLCGWFILLSSLAAALPARAQEKSEEHRRAEAVQRELKRLMEDERREQCKRDYQAVVSRAERAAKIFDELFAATQAYTKQAEALLRSDDGKKLAGDDVSLIAYIDLLDHPAVTSEEVQAKRASLDSTLELLRRQEEMVAEGHRPSEQIQDDVQQSFFWARDAQGRFKSQQAKFDTILAKAPPVADPASAILLDEAIRNHRTRIPRLSAEAQLAGREIAEDSTRAILVDAAVLAELKDAQVMATQLIAEANARADKVKLELEKRISELQKSIDTERTRMRIEEDNRAAELKRKEEGAAATRHAEDVDAKIDRDATVSAADKKVLEQRCRDPKVKLLLAPFLSEGYLRPDGTYNAVSFKGNYDTVKPVPISLKDLAELGALSQTGAGCDALYSIGADPRDELRTRWPGAHDWRKDSRTRDLVPKAQKLLIELGPTLAELGMLQP